MKHTGSGAKVIVEASDGASRVTLFDYGDADYLEDRLVEAHDIEDIQRTEDQPGRFNLLTPISVSALQSIIDQIE